MTDIFANTLTRQGGRFELVQGSTLFRDQIADLPLELHVKFLRVLENGQMERIGSTRTLTVDVRLIAATNRDLAATEHAQIRAALDQTGWRIRGPAGAAELRGLKPTTFVSRIPSDRSESLRDFGRFPSLSPRTAPRGIVPNPVI